MFWTVTVGLALGALMLSACGGNLSGEPKIVRESEIQSMPTRTPAPTVAVETTTEAASEDEGAGDGEDVADVPPAVDGDYDRGFDLFVQNCAMCHGAEDGVGPSLSVLTQNAATRIEGMTADEYIYQSITDPSAYVVEGYTPVMPNDFAERLSEQDLRDLVVFVRDFDPAKMGMTGGEGAEEPSAETTASPHATMAPVEGGTTTIRGTVELGTADGEPLPPELPVHLYAVDPHGNIAVEQETTTTEDNTFEFTDVPRAAGMAYFIQIDYQDVPQGTWIPDIEGTEDELSADVTLYERTTDPDTVAITWAQMLVNYAPIKEFGVEVWLDLEITNTGDRIVTTDEVSERNGWYVSVEISLPPAAFGIQPMQAEGSSRYEVVADENGVPVVRDTWPLRPGQVHTITVAYYLPYEDEAVFDHIFNYPVVDGVVLLPNDTVEFKSDQFDPEGTWSGHVSHGGVRVTALEPDEEIDPENDFTLVKAHTLLEAVPAGESLRFELIGQPTRTTELMPPSHPDTASADTQTDWLPLALGAAGGGLVALALVAWWWQRRGSVTVPDAEDVAAEKAPTDFVFELPPKDAGKEALLAALDALEQAHEAGEVEDAEYREYRATLTERLLPYLNDED